MHNIFYYILLILSFLFLEIKLSFSQTIVKVSEVSGKWTKKESPYIVQNNLIVPFGESLLIEKGVDVIIDGNYLITIRGNFTAWGSQSDSVRFFPSESSRIWRGFKIEREYLQLDNDSVFFYYTLIKNASKKGYDYSISPNEFGGAFYIKNYIRFKLIHCRLTNNFSSEKGGAVYFENGGQESEIKFSNFVDNESVNGGAVFCQNANLTIFSNLFKGNISQENGGAIYLSSDISTISHNIFKQNRAENTAGVIFVGENSKTKIHDNIFQKNSAGENGGALGCYYHSEPSVLKNIFRYNKAQNNGGAIFVDDYSYPLAITNNLIYSNFAIRGGAIAVYNSQAGIFSNTICKNSAVEASAIYLASYVPVEITNNIIYDNKNNTNTSIYIEDNTAPPFITYNCIQYGLSAIYYSNKDILSEMTEQIIDDDPMFFDSEKNDFRLTINSPCIDQGENENSFMKLPEKDLNANRRIMDYKIDLGAFEFNAEKEYQ